MHPQMQIYWKLHFERYPNAKLLKGFRNLLSCYLVEDTGNILDLGCGQSEYILDLINKDFHFYAIDEDEQQLDLLKQRILIDAKDAVSKVSFLKDSIPKIKLPEVLFNGVVLSNLLHFFTMKQLVPIMDDIKSRLAEEAVIVIVVHSRNHSSNIEGDPHRYSYFKHYFSVSDLESFFPLSEFKCMYQSITSKRRDEDETALVKEWIERVCIDLQGITDREKILRDQRAYLSDDFDETITMVFKKL